MKKYNYHRTYHSEDMTAIQQCTMLCSNSQNYNHMHWLLTNMCPNTFRLEQLTPTRSKKIRNGKCCWTAFYAANNLIRISDVVSFNNRRKELCARIPFLSSIVECGRYGESTHGIFVKLCNTACNCSMDFRFSLTSFPILEQSIFHRCHLVVYRYSKIRDHDEDEDDYHDEVLFQIEYTKINLPAICTKTVEGVVLGFSGSAGSLSRDNSETNWLTVDMDAFGDKESIFRSMMFKDPLSPTVMAGIDVNDDEQLYYLDPYIFKECHSKVVSLNSTCCDYELRENLVPIKKVFACIKIVS